MRTANGRCFGTNGALDGYDDSYSYLKNWVGTDYELTSTIYLDGANINRGVSNEVELLLRVSDNANAPDGAAFAYECNFAFFGGLAVIRWNGTPFNSTAWFDVLPASGPQTLGREFVTGDVVKARIVGTSIKMYVNGIELLSATVSDGAPYTTGKPGIGGFTRPGGDLQYYCISDFLAVGV